MKKLAIVLAGAMIPVGLAACGPPAHPLPCTAVAGAATQGGTETVAVHSVGGAGVLARASYRHTAPGVLASTDAAGLAHISFPVPDAGYRVKVTVITVHGHQLGSCAAYFTPSPRKVGTPKPPVPPIVQPKPPVPPSTTPPLPAPPQKIDCHNVDFFNGGGRHTYAVDLRATGTTCVVATALATGVNDELHSPNPIYEGLVYASYGLACTGFPTDNGSQLGFQCNNDPAVPSELVTFIYVS